MVRLGSENIEKKLEYTVGLNCDGSNMRNIEKLCHYELYLKQERPGVKIWDQCILFKIDHNRSIPSFENIRNFITYANLES